MSPKSVPRNAEYKNDNDYSLQINRWYLKPIGAWPLASASSTVEKVFVLLQIIVCMSTVFVIMVPCLLYVSFEPVAFQLRLSAVGPLLNRITGSVTYWVLLRHNANIRDCVRHMETDWGLVGDIDDREIMMQHAKFGRFIAVISGIFMQSAIFLYGVAKALSTVTVPFGNETITMHPMTCPAYSKIIDTRFSPVNEIMVIVQIVSAFVAGSSTVGSCSLTAVFATHACGQLNVLYTKLDQLVGSHEKDDRVERRLAAIVDHHLRVLSFISRIENIMHKACLAQVMGCTIMMCMGGYYSIMYWNKLDAAQISSYMMMYVTLAFNIFIFCYIGEIITEKCKHVGEIAYTTNWYQLHHKTARGLILIIARSNNVIKITAGKLFQLSIVTFGDVFKTSIVYLNLLRTLTT